MEQSITYLAPILCNGKAESITPPKIGNIFFADFFFADFLKKSLLENISSFILFCNYFVLPWIMAWHNTGQAIIFTLKNRNRSYNKSQSNFCHNHLYKFRNRCFHIRLHNRCTKMYMRQNMNYSKNNHIPLALFRLLVTATESLPILLRRESAIRLWPLSWRNPYVIGVLVFSFSHSP